MPLWMLSVVLSTKETTMREQYLLFETEQRRWAQRVWQALDPETRSRIIGTLAEMALARLRRAPAPPAKERGDDA
jgi:hypothetical protein